MNYKEEVEERLTRQYGRCAIKDDFLKEKRSLKTLLWSIIIICRRLMSRLFSSGQTIRSYHDDFKKKINALNFFEEIHFGVLDESHLRRCIDNFEAQLVQCSHVKNYFNKRNHIMLNEANFSTSTRTVTDTRLSLILSFNEDFRDEIRQELQYINGYAYPHSDIFSEKEFIELISEFREILPRSPRPIKIIKKGRPFIWVADNEEINEIEAATRLENEIDVATKLKDTLGLYKNKGEVLFKVSFNNDPGYGWHKPTFFHSLFGHHWKPAYRDDGWGITLDLSNFNDGVKESVAINNIFWSANFDIQFLGECTTGIPEDSNWENYFYHRLRTLRNRCSGDEAILNDFKYFLKTININYNEIL